MTENVLLSVSKHVEAFLSAEKSSGKLFEIQADTSFCRKMCIFLELMHDHGRSAIVFKQIAQHTVDL